MEKPLKQSKGDWVTDEYIEKWMLEENKGEHDAMVLGAKMFRDRFAKCKHYRGVRKRVEGGVEFYCKYCGVKL